MVLIYQLHKCSTSTCKWIYSNKNSGNFWLSQIAHQVMVANHLFFCSAACVQGQYYALCFVWLHVHTNHQFMTQTEHYIYTHYFYYIDTLFVKNLKILFRYNLCIIIFMIILLNIFYYSSYCTTQFLHQLLFKKIGFHKLCMII